MVSKCVACSQHEWKPASLITCRWMTRTASHFQSLHSIDPMSLNKTMKSHDAGLWFGPWYTKIAVGMVIHLASLLACSKTLAYF
eukprot:4217400-Amphidinium_carterae.1